MPASTFETPEEPRDSPKLDWEVLERRVADFEAAWCRGERPQIGDYLDAQSPHDRRLLLELVHTELELRIKAGEPVTAESYLDLWPELASQSSVAEGLRSAERRLRERMAASRDTLLHVGDSVMPAGDGTAYDDSGSEPGDVDHAALPTLPGYRFVREVGRGGMGIVYEAIDLTLDRTVAIKTDRYHSDIQERSRLRREAESAARLQHPNVAQVFQVVEHAGRVYVVSEFLPGGTLADRIDAHPLAARAAAALLEPLAAAVAYAHERGVIHRDLKPANVLFTADGTPKVADFGLAKLISDSNDLTRTGVFSGSPAYMSPEQAAGRRNVGPEADIWSLGIILYELLTGRPPFCTPTVIETLDQLRTVDPVSPRALVPTLPRDLETVCLKCIEKLPANRYATAHSLVTDLQHFLKGEAVTARPIGWIERTRRWTLRHRNVAVLLFLLAGSLVGVATAVAVYANEAARNAALEMKLHKEAEDLRDEAAQLAQQSARHEQQAQTLKYIADLRRAGDAVADGLPGEATDTLADYEPNGVDSHSFVFHYLNRSARVPSQVIDTFSPGPSDSHAVWFVRLSPDRKTLAACGANGEICFYDTENWKKRDTIAAGQGEVNGLAYTSDGTRLASAGDDGSVVLWDLTTHRPIWKTKVTEELAFEVAFGLDESLIAVCGRDHDIHLLDAAAGKVLGTLPGHTDWVQSLAVTPDGTTLFSASEDHTGAAWDLATRKQRWTTSIGGPVARFTDVSVSDDGRWVAFGAVNTALSLNDVETGEQLYKGGIGGTRWDGAFSGSFRSIAFSPGSRDLVVAIEGGTLIRARFDSRTGVTVLDDPRPAWKVSQETIRSFVAFEDNIVIASDDGDIKRLNFRQNLPWKAIPFKGAWDLAWVTGADGRSQIAVASDEGQLLVDPDTGAKQILTTDLASNLCACASGRHILFSRPGGSLVAYDLTTEPPRVDWTLDGRTLLHEFIGLTPQDLSEINVYPVAGPRQNLQYSVLVHARKRVGGTVRRCLVNLDARTGKILAHHRDDEMDGDIVVSADGRRIATCRRLGYVQILDAATLQKLDQFRVHRDSVSAVGFSPRTGDLAVADHALKISLWRDGAKIREWPAGNTRFDSLVFSADGQTLIACGRNRAPQLWDVATGRLLLRLDGRPAKLSTPQVSVAMYSPDGGQIAVSGDKHLLVFNGRPPVDDTAPLQTARIDSNDVP